MIDVHMIDGGKFPKLAAQNREAVKHPLITLHDAPWVDQNLRLARLQGFSMGTNPYVSFIDDDDDVLDVSWIGEAVQILEGNPGISAVYPRYETYHNGRSIKTLPIQDPWNAELHRRPPPVAHHLTIMRRENVLEIHEHMKIHPIIMREQDVILTQAMLRFGRMHPVQNIAYRWHLRPGSARLSCDIPTVRNWSYEYTEETFRVHYALKHHLQDPIRSDQP
jgi:hypothetical protein